MKRKTLTIVLATRNRGKLAEYRQLFSGLDVELLSVDDYEGIRMPPENGETFEQNAASKARYIARVTGKIAIADDSGLLVNALDGKPGVHSKRFGGPGGTDRTRNSKLLSMMKGRKDRDAFFTCAIAIADTSSSVTTVSAQCHGKIADKPKGTGGFGYDPVFIVPSMGKTFAEISRSAKNRISHRGKAMRKALRLIRTLSAQH